MSADPASMSKPDRDHLALSLDLDPPTLHDSSQRACDGVDDGERNETAALANEADPEGVSQQGQSCSSSSQVTLTKICLELLLPISEFHLFPNMALEIRRKIWKLALPAPRILTLQFIQVDDKG